MTLKLIVEKLARDNKKFILSSEIKEYCSKLSLDYLPTIKYLLRNKYVARIFRGIFYAYSIEERKLGKSEVSFWMILKKASEIKGVKNWYFGLETGLKLNNLTHEYFTIEYVINDKIFRAKPITIMGRKVKFYKLSPKMFLFGIIKRDINYSDSEKTLLDLLYLKHYTKEEFEEAAKELSKTKLLKYAKNYNKRVVSIVKGIGMIKKINNMLKFEKYSQNIKNKEIQLKDELILGGEEALLLTPIGRGFPKFVKELNLFLKDIISELKI